MVMSPSILNVAVAARFVALEGREVDGEFGLPWSYRSVRIERDRARNVWCFAYRIVGEDSARELLGDPVSGDSAGYRKRHRSSVVHLL